MKKARKKRKRKVKVENLKAELETKRKLKDSAKQNCLKYSGMSRTYWERWQWELQERRQLMIRAARPKEQVTKFILPSIDPSMLEDPVIDGERKENYIGRGSFRIVRHQLYRDMKVAVKEFLPHSLRNDVINEAHILASLSHAYIPCFLGVCPKNIVMQFHSPDGKQARTLFQELRGKKLNSSNLVFAFCAQLMEAIHYLHHEKEILHNDITTTNIVIENDHIVLIDFGKAVKLSEQKCIWEKLRGKNT